MQEGVLMVTQFKKGVLELCVLSLISKKDCYGYEIVEVISRAIEVSEGTIYPLLRRLITEKYCTTYLKENIIPSVIPDLNALKLLKRNGIIFPNKLIT